jgi:parvulin-like peptidyl-prolyl isomerase
MLCWLRARRHNRALLMRLHYLLFVLPVVVLVAGCGGGGGGSVKLNPDDVAVVSGTHITKAKFDSVMSQQRLSLKAQGQTFPKAGTTAYASLRSQVINVLVQNAEFEAEAAKLGVKVGEKDVQTQLDQIRKQYFGGSQKRYEQELKKQGYTDDAVRDQIHSQLLAQRLFEKVTADARPTDKEVHDYFVAHASDYPPTREVAEILVGKGKQALATKIYKQIKSGDSFAALAKKYSQDPGSKNIGGKFTAKKGQDVPEFDAAVFAPKATTGKLLQPVNTAQYGWFVIKLVGPVNETTEAEVADAIRTQLEPQNRNEEMTAWVSKVTKSYCKGDRVKYQAGYQPSFDPCTTLATATNTTSTTG